MFFLLAIKMHYEVYYGSLLVEARHEVVMLKRSFLSCRFLAVGQDLLIVQSSFSTKLEMIFLWSMACILQQLPFCRVVIYP